VAEWFTPPQVARERAVRVGKVLAWIASGELEAVNHATGVLGRPRWRVSAEALRAFDRARSNRSRMLPATPRTTRRAVTNVTEYF